MKYLVIVAVLLLALLPTSVMAYTPPSQSSDNATDVILWNGDNVTIESANLTGTVSLSGTLAVTDLNDTVEDIADDYRSLLMVAFIVILALVTKSIVLKGLACPVCFVYGLTVATGNNTYDTMWTAGVGIAILGIYFLFDVAAEPVKRMLKL